MGTTTVTGRPASVPSSRFTRKARMGSAEIRRSRRRDLPAGQLGWGLHQEQGATNSSPRTACASTFMARSSRRMARSSATCPPAAIRDLLVEKLELLWPELRRRSVSVILLVGGLLLVLVVLVVLDIVAICDVFRSRPRGFPRPRPRGRLVLGRRPLRLPDGAVSSSRL